MCYLCAVIWQRRSPFGSRSMFDRFPLVLRYSFVRPSFVLRSVSVREARCNGDVTDKEKIRNKSEYQSQRSLKWFVTRSQKTKNIRSANSIFQSVRLLQKPRQYCLNTTKTSFVHKLAVWLRNVTKSFFLEESLALPNLIYNFALCFSWY